MAGATSRQHSSACRQHRRSGISNSTHSPLGNVWILSVTRRSSAAVWTSTSRNAWKRNNSSTTFAASSFARAKFPSFSSRVKSSKKLKYQDLKSNIGYFTHQFVVELLPICRDDLVLLPRGIVQDIPLPLAVCTKVGPSLCFVHPSSARVWLERT